VSFDTDSSLNQEIAKTGFKENKTHTRGVLIINTLIWYAVFTQNQSNLFKHRKQDIQTPRTIRITGISQHVVIVGYCFSPK